MKKNTLLFLLNLSIVSFSQCPFNNTFYVDLTPASQGGTVSESCVWGGDLITSSVINGETYIISLCGNTGFEDSQITLYDASGTTVLDYNDDFCDLYSEVTWTATYTGVLNIVIDEFSCVSGTNCMELDITWENDLGIDNFNNRKIIFYPNPVKDIITFDLLSYEKYEVSLFEINGRLLLFKEINSEVNTLDLSNLNSGVYQMMIKNEKEKKYEKVIKK